jgi:O-antigen/teichoic acid export membrane protein
MKSPLARLTGDSAVYGISTILGRFLNFLLVPFYTNVFPASEYGIVTVVYSALAFLAVLYTAGMEPAYMRFLEQGDADRRRAVFGTAFWSVAALAAVLTGVLLLFSDAACAALEIRPVWSAIVPLAAATLAVDALNAIPFASLRMERRARQFAFIRVTSIVINIGLNLLFVLVLRLSVVSVFLAGLLASLSSTALLLPVVARNTTPPSRALLRPMLVFGLPTLPAGIAAMVIQVIDRLLMQKLADTATAGIYGANYRLGVFMMLVVSMFQYAWQPFFLQEHTRPDARALFARVLTYFLAMACTVTLTVSFFIDDAATIPLFHHRTLLGREYWSGLGIVPVVLFAYIWTGAAVIFNAGLLIRKKTVWLAAVTGTGAVVNIVANLLLIPRIGMTGGALATLLAYMVMAIAYWALSLRIYPVPYEYGRIARLALAFAAPAAVWRFVPAPAGLAQPLWELLLLAAFPILLVALRFFRAEELRALRGLADRFRGRGTPA